MLHAHRAKSPFLSTPLWQFQGSLLTAIRPSLRHKPYPSKPIPEIDILWVTTAVWDALATIAMIESNDRGRWGNVAGWPGFWRLSQDARCVDGRIKPGFRNKLIPLIKQAPSSFVSPRAIRRYGKSIRAWRRATHAALNQGPARRRQHAVLADKRS